MVRARDVVLCMFPLGTAYLLIALSFSTYTAPRRANDVFRNGVTLPVRRSKKELLQIAAVYLRVAALARVLEIETAAPNLTYEIVAYC